MFWQAIAEDIPLKMPFRELLLITDPHMPQVPKLMQPLKIRGKQTDKITFGPT
jgi:hypothetical protein